MKLHKGVKVGLTFGAYDLFHEGHLNIFENAKKYCDFLVVCVSTNSYLMKYKGHRSIIPLKTRMRLVQAIRYVDAVDIQSLVFGKKEAIKKYSPDVLLVGSDHRKDYTGKGLGVKVVYLPHTDGISSTILRKKLRNL